MIEPGTKLGAFEITELLGKGGMGEVYRARDEKLGRDVAVKVLPESLAGDAERLARFEREAQTLASLNHPNIATVHGFEHDAEQGVHFLVMEYITGETLGDRIAAGALSDTEALPLFVEIARGLDAAHGAGIVHRDIKPDNVKINEDGVVKILDFGIAKGPEVANNVDPNAAMTPMSPVAVTAEGTFMGMPVYMSPEQARGKAVDKRTDIWAFGCCLFEALTGKLPFEGDTVADTVGAIMEREPDWDRLPKSTPRRVRKLLERCLQKDVKLRLRDIGDAWVELSAPEEEEAVVAESGGTMRLVIVGLVVALTGFAAGSMLVGGGVPNGAGSGGGSGSGGEIQSLAVLPLENMMNDEEQDYFVDGMTEAITSELSKFGALRVTSRTSAMRFKGSTAPVSEIAEELGVDALIEGSVFRAGDEVRITVQLVRGSTDENLWSGSYEGSLEDVLGFQSKVALSVVDAIEIAVTQDEQGQIARTDTTVPEAYDEFLKGMKQLEGRSELELRRAIAHFERAVVFDPDYSTAYARMASTYALLSIYWFEDSDVGYPKSEEFARKALDINEYSSEAYSALQLYTNFYKMDVSETLRLGQRAIELDPNNALSYFWMGGSASYMGALDAARAAYERTYALAPDNPIIRIGLEGQFPLFSGDARTARDNLNKLAEEIPDHPFLLWTLWASCMALDEAEEVLAITERFRELYPENPSYKALWGAALAGVGEDEQARTVLEEVSSLPDDVYVSALAMAMLHFSLEDEERGFEFLEKTRGELNGGSALRVTPMYAEMREDERIWEIIDPFNMTPLPPSHPVYAREQEHLQRKAAREALESQPKPVTRMRLYAPPGEEVFAAFQTVEFAISRDGRAIGFMTGQPPYLEVSIRRLDSFDLVTSDDWVGRFEAMRFTPDGQSLYVQNYSDQEYAVFRLDGVSMPAVPQDAGLGRDWDWLPDGSLVYIHQSGDEYHLMHLKSGEDSPEEVITLDLSTDERAFVDLVVLPESNSAFYTKHYREGRQSPMVYLVDFDAGEEVFITQGAAPQYSEASDHLVFRRGMQLHAAPFDRDTLEVLGEPVVVLSDITINREQAEYVLSPSGTLVYMPSQLDVREADLVIMHSEGEVEVVARDLLGVLGPFRPVVKLDPSESRIAFSMAGGPNEHSVWIYDRADARPPLRLTRGSADQLWAWSNDGKRVLFSLRSSVGQVLYTIAADGSESEPTMLFEHVSRSGDFVEG